MLEKKQDGIYIDTATNQVVFEYDELDEASQRSFDTLSKSIRENPPKPWVQPKHKNQAVERVLGDLRKEVLKVEESIFYNDGESDVHDTAIMETLEEIISILNNESKFDNMEPNDVFVFVKNYFVEKKNEADLAILDNSAEEDVLEGYYGVEWFCEKFIDGRLKEKYNV
jgi:hypothetical protein